MNEIINYRKTKRLHDRLVEDERYRKEQNISLDALDYCKAYLMKIANDGVVGGGVDDMEEGQIQVRYYDLDGDGRWFVDGLGLQGLKSLLRDEAMEGRRVVEVGPCSRDHVQH